MDVDTSVNLFNSSRYSAQSPTTDFPVIKRIFALEHIRRVFWLAPRPPIQARQQTHWPLDDFNNGRPSDKEEQRLKVAR